MSRFSRRADKRVRKIAKRQSKRFNSKILANAVYDHVLQDDLLARTVDIVEELDELQYQAESDSNLSELARRGRYELENEKEIVDVAIERSVDEALEDVAETIDEWDDDVWSDEAKQAATRELREFWDSEGADDE
ncbi:hypothetical protein [Natrinema sp. DC36]|uniref:hypothetical protein n=1 Tax=Natrinema sp. DC36 TaxID=2878680 RepID=UPI001CF0B3AC|nr:hypothetical protein [Natrinema sp. DC36]